MRTLFLIFLFISFSSYSQSEENLAEKYFKDGDFEKALIQYKKLVSTKKNNYNYIIKLIKTHQQLEQYTEAENLINKEIKKRHSPLLFIELGHNHALKKDSISAALNYNKAIQTIEKNPRNAYSIGRAFQELSLLNEAITSYEKATALKPELNFNIQLAKIYGEQGEIEKMFTSYINYNKIDDQYINSIKREFSTFINETPENENNIILKNILLKKIQKSPEIIWNEMLSWLFIQQKQLKKAFIQEKAIYKRELESLNRIEELGHIAINQKENTIAKTIFQFIIDNTQDINTKLRAHLNKIEIETLEASTSDYDTINESYSSLLKEYGNTERTIKLQIAHAHFLAFYLHKTDNAITKLKDALKLKTSKQNIALIKLELGDILVLKERFNEALIYYTQIQRSLKNSTISQMARFKVAKTSYYKGDFKWAESQLKILKQSTSQLTANDALDLKLLISDNKAEDSLQVALKQYAKADLLAFQNKTKEAITTLDAILEHHKTEAIIAQTLLKQAQLFELEKELEQAKKNYEQLIENHKESILIDDAIFALANLYENELNQPEKAKTLYESIIFNHADSIYFVESRKRFRALRGDTIN